MTSTRPSAPPDVDTLLRLLTADPGRPRLTWYGDDGERVELSGAVLENWVNKTTNLLVEELDVGPGTRVALDLPAHWRTVLWTLATWRAGASAVVGTDEVEPDVVVTSRPDASAAPGRGPALVVVTLAALARRAPDPVPPGAIDAAAAVMTYGDRLGWVPPAEAAQTALGTAGTPVTHAELAAWWAPDDERERVLLGASPDVAGWLRDVCRTLAGDGSLVLLSPARATHLAQPGSADELARLVAGERITRTVLGTT